ncbi:unnamed protein product [marine sediment metagenome]|uniref:Uncharacterized protein n=1 Tax=marine sediment metagenome TaxID=412755 RepID=X1HCL8_9ZZZZ
MQIEQIESNNSSFPFFGKDKNCLQFSSEQTKNLLFFALMNFIGLLSQNGQFDDVRGLVYSIL